MKVDIMTQVLARECCISSHLTARNARIEVVSILGFIDAALHASPQGVHIFSLRCTHKNLHHYYCESALRGNFCATINALNLPAFS